MNNVLQVTELGAVEVEAMLHYQIIARAILNTLFNRPTHNFLHALFYSKSQKETFFCL